MWIHAAEEYRAMMQVFKVSEIYCIWLMMWSVDFTLVTTVMSQLPVCWYSSLCQYGRTEHVTVLEITSPFIDLL